MQTSELSTVFKWSTCSKHSAAGWAAVRVINVCITFVNSLIIAHASATQVNVCHVENLWHHKSHQFNTRNWHRVYVEVAHLSHSQTQSHENGITWQSSVIRHFYQKRRHVNLRQKRMDSEPDVCELCCHHQISKQSALGKSGSKCWARLGKMIKV